jgi:hypothetical protein
VIVSATYPTGKVRYEAPVAGQRIEPRKIEDELPAFVLPDSMTEVAPSEFLIWEFHHHTADHPECASSIEARRDEAHLSPQDVGTDTEVPRPIAEAPLRGPHHQRPSPAYLVFKERVTGWGGW